MSAPQSKPLGKKWKERFDLSNREAPEFYEKIDNVRSTPHASAIRTALEELGTSAVFCVQGVPTIVILLVDDYDRKAIVNLHAALWNQGLASLLLVLSGDTVRAFSLARIPYAGADDGFESRCLIQELDAVANALALKDIIYGAESGRLWEKHASYFQPKERIDQVFLENLTVSHQLLCDAELSPDAAQALLIQTMFIAYLEDRGVTTKRYFLSATDNRADTFSTLLSSANVNFINRLFENLRKDFNGDLFVAPCSFEPNGPRPRLNRAHLDILSRFRVGREEMGTGAGQYRFWGYDFKYIPIELISAVYDRFLGERDAERREQGAYYTPMFLADTVVSQVWEILSLAVKEKGQFLDPACGSGVFLVRSFQRMCEHWRETHKSQTIRWDSLLIILARLHGRDLNSGAVRVAVFSLYIALLEEVSPPDIRLLIERGKFLPELWGHNLCHADFFSVSDQETKVDVVIGNPPWTSRRGVNRSSVKWCATEHVPMPSQEDAWAFVWKSLRHLRESGVVAFLLPAMAFLHNHAASAVAARNRLLQDARIWRIINFADLRFQLFEGAVRPAALIVFGRATGEAPGYRFDYWAPKADLNLRIKRLITLSSADRSSITSQMAIEDPLVFKRRLWMTEPEGKLFSYLSAFPKLAALISIYGQITRQREFDPRSWVMGDGFKQAVPGRLNDPGYDTVQSNYVGKLPHITVQQLSPLAVSRAQSQGKWDTNIVHRKGFEEGYRGPRILVPRGVQLTSGRLRAAFCEDELTFSSIIQAITIPTGDERKGKLLTAILNSRVAFWYAFHGTASLGSDRPEIQKSELMRLPFPLPEHLPEPARAERAETQLVSLIDKRTQPANSAFTFRGDDSQILMKIDRLVCEYFCLSADESTLISDAVERIIPAVQPSQGSFPSIWKPADRKDREAYATTLVRSMADWFDGVSAIQVRLEAHNADLAVLCLTLEEGRPQTEYNEKNGTSVSEALTNVFKHIHRPLPGNFQLMPNFRLFIGNDLYLVKPAQKRFWLRSTALADADAIALDLQDVVASRNNWGRG
jgi:hypothetical protein